MDDIHFLCGKNILFTHGETVGNMTVIKICFSHRMHEIRYLYDMNIKFKQKEKEGGEAEKRKRRGRRRKRGRGKIN